MTRREIVDLIRDSGGTRTGRFEENQFFAFADGSRLAVADEWRGVTELRAMPSREG